MHQPRIDLAALVRLHKQQRGAAAGIGDGRLVEVPDFGPNPGALRMLAHLPANLRRGAPLVVALHGCTQTAAGYDRGCGWSAMADRLGFALLLPEQRRANNPNLCFNWFEPGDATRGAGEAASIRAGIAHTVAAHGLDPDRIFVTGLSAGGAMTAVMLATYPEVFAAGAVVAGLPYGAGWGVPEALRAMSQPGDLTPAARGDAVRRAGRHGGAWPRVSIWHGNADATVQSGNAEASVRQWLDLHGLAGAAPVVLRRSPSHVVRRWHGADGRVRVEDHRIAGMGHGVPLSPGVGDDCCGEAGAYMLDVGVSSTHGILAFWGLEDAPAEAPRPIHVPSVGVPPRGVLVVNEAGEVFTGPRPDFATPPPEARPEPRATEAPPKRPGGVDITAVIEAAHRAAGLIGR